MDSIIREMTEIEPHPNNINREDWFFLNMSWKPFIHTLKEQKTEILSKNKTY
jgi:hypothetical protein